MSPDQDRRADHHRLTVLGLLLTFGLAVIVAQLVRYQVFMHAELAELASEQRSRETELVPRRGFIADANGRVLAVDVYQWDIEASPTLITEPQKLAVDLAPLLGMEAPDLYGRLTSDAKWLRLARQVPQQTGEVIAAWKAGGLMCRSNARRTYPMGQLAAHVTGFVNHTGNGYYGVEGYYNSLLLGISGTLEYESDAGGAAIPIPPTIMHSPLPGADLFLTLDLNIQQIAQEELARAIMQSKAQSGTVIILDPKTGALLALTSLPTYDPNEYATTDRNLLADPSVSRMWEPGSVFKIITWGAGLDAGIISPETTVFDEGKMEVGGRVIENSDRMAHGKVTMTEALAQSLNTIAAYISTTLGKERFYNYVRRFGFGDLSGVDLGSEGPGMLKLPGDSNWYPSDLGTNSFGQGIAVTPMQMVTAVAAVANDGRLMKPHIIREIITEGGPGQEPKVVMIKPEMVRQAISRDAAHTLTSMLVKAVELQASEARVHGYRVAGKTGTAQIPTAFGYDPKDTIVSFVGYAPADDPSFIVLIKLDKPKASRWAGQTAAPAFRAIAERLFAYMHIPPDQIRLAQQ